MNISTLEPEGMEVLAITLTEYQSFLVNGS